MKTRLFVLIVNILAGIVINVNKFDFGLFENEPLLIDLHREDLELTDSIAEANDQFNNEEISDYLEKERVLPEVSYISHPVNAYHLIKKHTLTFNDLLLGVGVEVKERLEELRNRTELIRTLQDDDLKRSRNALAVIIHSYDMDLDTFARGEIEANSFGNGASPLQASRGLSANDLGNIAISAMEYGFLGTASVILKAALSRARQGGSSSNDIMKMTILTMMMTTMTLMMIILTMITMKMMMMMTMMMITMMTMIMLMMMTMKMMMMMMTMTMRTMIILIMTTMLELSLVRENTWRTGSGG